MAVQVLIRRKFVAEKADQVAPLMVSLRTLAREQSGFLSSESLRCIDPVCEDEYLIRSTWRSREDWQRWLNSPQRKGLQAQVDAVTGENTEYRVYEILVGGFFQNMAKDKR